MSYMILLFWFNVLFQKGVKKTIFELRVTLTLLDSHDTAPGILIF
jgi:hypothetical protein